VFGAKDGDDTADPDGITQCATRLMDLYERFLQLAERARGMSAPPEFVNALDSCARLVDRPLAGMDQFIDEYVAYVNGLAQLAADERESEVRHVITLPIPAVSAELLAQLKRQLDDAFALEQKAMPS
jgi:hypothetical protein